MRSRAVPGFVPGETQCSACYIGAFKRVVGKKPREALSGADVLCELAKNRVLEDVAA